jgi:non-heme chloroperoxidase
LADDSTLLRPDQSVLTLVVGGKASLVPWKSQVWIAKQIRRSRLEIFEDSEGGTVPTAERT